MADAGAIGNPAGDFVPGSSSPSTPTSSAAGRLVDVLVQNGNESGSVRTAPHSLKNLKKSVQGVPFQLLVPGMAGVLNASGLTQVIQALAKMPGLNISAIGKFQQILGQVAAAQQGGQQLQPQDVVAAMGPGGAIGAAMLQFGGALQALQQSVNQPQSQPLPPAQDATANT